MANEKNESANIKAPEDPTRFTTRSFAVVWNEGHSVRLINRRDARQAISIPWREVDALRAICDGTRPAATPATEAQTDLSEWGSGFSIDGLGLHQIPAPTEAQECREDCDGFDASRVGDGSECAWGVCPRPRWCNQYCEDHHASKCVFPAVVIPEDELPPDMPKEDYDAWYAQSWVTDGVGCRVGPVYPFPAVGQGDDTPKLDLAIQQLVECLNTKGIRTFQSCSGHEDSESHPSACIWVEQVALSVERAELLSQRTGIEQVGLLFGRETVPVWEIEFAGETLPDFQAAQEAIIEHVTTGSDDTEQQARERLAMLVQDGSYSLVAQHCSDTSKDRDITGDVEALCALRSRPVGEWQPIETVPRDGSVILRPHSIWGAMAVRFKPREINGVQFEWLNSDYGTAWPDGAFLPFWVPQPDSPAARSQPVEEGDHK